MRHSESSQPVWAAVLFWWTLAAVTLPNLLLSITEDMCFAGRLANILLPGGLWWLVLCSGPGVGARTLWLFPLMFFGAFQIVLLYLYGRSVIAVDMFLNLVTTNPQEVGELLGNLGTALLVVASVYLPPLGAAIFACRRHWRVGERFMLKWRLPSVTVIGCGAACMVAAYAWCPVYSALNDLFPANVLYNVGLAVDRTVKTESLTNDAFTHSARFVSGVGPEAEGRSEILIAVIGETARGDRWQLNGYRRPTNAPMEGQGWISFPYVMSESNTTHKSVPMLLSHLDAHSFGDSIYYVKSFISAFREAGGQSAFLSNQRYNHSFIDRFAAEADTTVFIREEAGFSSNPSDLDLLPLVRQMLSGTRGRTLIVLHTYGSHFNYADRYEGIAPTFTPDRPLQAQRRYKRQLDNAYDNTICLTSTLLADLARMLENDSVCAAVLYTSDHGEDIFDDDRNLFLHASPRPSIHQVHVPFSAWLSPEFEAAHPSIAAALKANRGRRVSSSRSFFHTLCTLGAVSCAVSDSSASVALGSYAEPEAVYLDDHNECIPLEKAL